MHKLNSKYQNETPIETIVLNRLKQLYDRYGGETVYVVYINQLKRMGSVSAWDGSSMLNVHLDNLILTYGRDVFDQMFEMLYHGLNSKVA